MDLSDSFYTRLIASGLFPLHEYLKGHSTVKVLKALEKSERWSADQLATYRIARLRDLLHHAYQYVPYYRSLFNKLDINPLDVTGLEALQRLPLLTKDIIRSHTRDLIAENAPNLIEYSTSGSTGQPLKFYISKERISHDVAAKWRAMRWWGVDIGDREIVAWGSPLELKTQDRVKRLRDKLLRTQLLPIISFDKETLDTYLAEIRLAKPRMMFGYPSAFAHLAQRAQERSLEMDDLGIRVIFTTSEILQPHWRKVIEAVFNCPVANEYGARDAGYIARECPSGGMHITAEDMIVETIDEQGYPAATGQGGEVVITHLASAVFPFIRYRTGDMAVLETSLCACGRALPLIKEITGRTNDYLVKADGTLIHGSAFNYVIRALEDVRSYQIIQDSLRDIRVLIAGGPGFKDDSLSRIQTQYKKLLGEDAAIDIKRVDFISPEASGKFRHIISRVSCPPVQ